MVKTEFVILINDKNDVLTFFYNEHYQPVKICFYKKEFIKIFFESEIKSLQVDEYMNLYQSILPLKERKVKRSKVLSWIIGVFALLIFFVGSSLLLLTKNKIMNMVGVAIALIAFTILIFNVFLYRFLFNKLIKKDQKIQEIEVHLDKMIGDNYVQKN